MSIDEATIAEIVKELQRTGVYVDDTLARQLPPAFQAELREQVAESKQPVFVAMVPLERDDPNFHGDSELLAGVLHGDVGEDGVYLTYSADRGTIDGTGFGQGFGEYYAWFAATKEHPKDLQLQLTKTIAYLDNGKGEQVYERLRAQERKEESGTSQPSAYPGDEGDGGGDTLLGLGAIVLVLGIVIVGARLAWRRRSGSASSSPSGTYIPGKGYVTDRPFVLPAATLSMIRQSRDQQLERRAEADVLALGEAIDRAEMKGTAAGSWQAALDHYDLARRILDRKHSQADVVGSLVLSRRGQSALAAASRGKAWRPQPSCYFNPMHGGGTQQVRWTGEAGDARVPACDACAHDLQRGREPDDVLDFVVDGRARHYFDLELAPWSSTGYGALDTDLTGRLFERG